MNLVETRPLFRIKPSEDGRGDQQKSAAGSRGKKQEKSSQMEENFCLRKLVFEGKWILKTKKCSQTPQIDKNGVWTEKIILWRK